MDAELPLTGAESLRALRPRNIGARAPRVEDDRLLTGRATFVADLAMDGMVEVAVVRSQLPHARIRVDTAAAGSVPGVVDVVTAGDLDRVRTMPEFVEWARPVGRTMLSADRARYVGAPVAAVVAADRYIAEDAAELVEVDYDPLAAVATATDAMAPGAPRLYDDWQDNAQVLVPGSDPSVDGVFAAAHRIVGGTYTMGRHAGIPLETRGCVASFADGRLTIWTSTQVPHWLRTVVPHVLAIAESDVRVVAPDVGGGFGVKWHLYPEEFLVAWLAMRVGRPVRWIEDRAEHLLAACHARDAVYDLEAACDERGRILAVRGRLLQDVGSAEIYPVGFGPSLTGLGGLTGPYRIPRVNVEVVAVVTNKTPSGAYRGYGLPEAQFAMERLMDASARAAGVDPVALRREMMLRPADLPFTAASGAVLDSGSFLEAFDDVVSRGRAAVARHRERRGDDPEARIGLAASSFVEGTAATGAGDTGLWGTQDSVAIRIDPDGGATVAAGVTTTGQGVRSMLAAIAADALDIEIDRVRVSVGDTDVAPYGLGGWASRSTVVASGAMLRAAAAIRAKAIRIAAHLLEAAAEDVVAEDGSFHPAGSPDRSVGWPEVATAALIRTFDLPPGEDPGLEATVMYMPPGVDHEPKEDGRMNACPTYANGSVAAVVKVDVETGAVEVLEYLASHDCGTLINPVIVDGQIHGGVAQGIGGALLEDIVYDANATPLVASFMDYLLPSATDVPPVSVTHFESPSPNTALGVKGVGEAGVVGAATVIAAAIEDALGPALTARIHETPITPARVWRLLGGGS